MFFRPGGGGCAHCVLGSSGGEGGRARSLGCMQVGDGSPVDPETAIP